jgi:beta-lactamase regulating signal transducer with metallopeptidase domain
LTDSLVQVGLSNLLLSGALGALAYAVHRRGRYPALAHLMWVLTLIKVITPPLLILPIASLPTTTAQAPVVGSSSADGVAALGHAGIAAGAWLTAHTPALLVAAWLIGSLVVLTVSTRRILRFGRLLRGACTSAPADVQRVADQVAFELGMRSAPSVYLSAARVAPMTWWTGGHIRVVLPEALRGEIDSAQLRWILAHELAHIKRHDHMVRWLEWLASVAFWWNPVVWWARRNLRRDEEDACDALVLEHLQGQPRAYARTLLTVVEVVATRGAQTPTLATGINAARSLEHRFTRIVAPGRRGTAPRYVAVATMAAAVLLMTVGVGAQSGEPVAASGSAIADPSIAEAATEELAPVEPAPLLVEPEPPAVKAPVSAPTPVAETLVEAPRTRLVSARINDEVVHFGTPRADVFGGTDADETIEGYGGADRLGGGPGRDTIRGGDGPDMIYGGRGADLLAGGTGRDNIGGGAGPDTIYGGAGADIVQGGGGRDTIYAGAGDDTVRVWADGVADTVDCGGGDDHAVIGSTDTATDCETVTIKDPE